MITNNQIKHIKSLHQSKFRQKYNNFIAEGDKIAQEILQNSIYKIEGVYATDKWIENNDLLARKHNEVLIGINSKEMKKISTLKTPSNILLVLQKQSEDINYSLINAGHAIYLDDVQDPGNIGTVIRIADWFGIGSVIRSSGCADFYNPKVIQSTMGSFINVNLYTGDFENLGELVHHSVGAIMEGESVYSFEWPTKTLLVMGNEGKGIRGAIQQQLDFQISIPGAQGRVADSLNVGIATGILCSSLSI